MHRLRLFIAAVALGLIFASSCSKPQPPANPPSDAGTRAARAATPPPVTGSAGSRVESAPAPIDNSTTGQQVSAGSETPSNPVPASPLLSDTQIQNFDTRLQEALNNFHKAAERNDRSTIASDVANLADAGVPKQQVASALGYMFRDENSDEVKTDILGDLGGLDDPSAFDQIVPALDSKQPDEVRTAAIQALDSLGDKRAIAVLQPLLTDRDKDVREAAQTTADSLIDH